MCSRLLILLLLIAGALLLCHPCAGQDESDSEQDSTLITLNEQNNLALLIDLCADRLDLNIEYDVDALRRESVNLRLGEGVTVDELWIVTNRLLASRGWTSVRMPGEDVLSIVQLDNRTGALADFTGKELERAQSGFTSTVVQAQHRSADELIAAIAPLLSEPSGAATRLGNSSFILLSDLSPRIDDVMGMVERLDQPGETILVDRITLENRSARELVTDVKAATVSWNAMRQQELLGSITPSADDRSVTLIMPESERATWRQFVKQFDEAQPIDTRTYIPNYYSVGEVAGLVQQLIGRQPRQQKVHVVIDDLTGALLITAPPEVHDQIANLIERLNDTPVGTRRPMRTFRIRNRDVGELFTILEDLIAQNLITGVVAQSDSQPVIQDSTSTGNDAPDNRRTRIPPRPGSPTDQSSSHVGRGGFEQSSDQVLDRGGSAERGFSTPSLTLTADEATNTLIAVGEPRVLDQLKTLLTTLDVRQPQVRLEVMIVSLSEAETLDLGVELTRLEVSGDTLISLSSLFGLSSIRAGSSDLLATPANGSGGGGSGFRGVVLNPGDFSVVLRALKSLNNGQTTSLPRVVVNNNQQATLDSILTAPYTSTNAFDTVASTSFGGSAEAGTQVTLTPKIAEGEHLILEYNVTVSSFVGESSDPSLPPPQQQNSLQSVVTIPDGYTIAMGGLQIDSEAESISQVPILGSLPVVGEAFRSRSKSKSTSRFYAFIRADVLRHDGFEDLKYLSDRELDDADVEDDWPEVQPRVIR